MPSRVKGDSDMDAASYTATAIDVGVDREDQPLKGENKADIASSSAIELTSTMVFSLAFPRDVLTLRVLLCVFASNITRLST